MGQKEAFRPEICTDLGPETLKHLLLFQLLLLLHSLTCNDIDVRVEVLAEAHS